jgi:hypothetical protein
MNREALWPRIEPDRLRRELQEGDDADLARRRGVILVSLAGCGHVPFNPGVERGSHSHLASSSPRGC